MTAAFDSSFDFANLRGLDALRNASDSPEAQRVVAKQFESLFLSMMIKQMRSASTIDGGLIDRERIDFQQGLLDQQLALTLAKGDGMGLADAILRSISGPGVTTQADGSGRALGLPIRAGRPGALPPATEPLAAQPQSRPLTALPATEPSAADSDGSTDALSDDSPTAFVEALWPHAERAARALGTVPEVIVAQAALETGWGRNLPRNQYGESSLNLFGIKAGPEWKGPRAVVTTLEFADGVAKPQREPFRMYGSLRESFDDYVELLRSKPRYANVLNADSAEGFARQLQHAGYATDPQYADKLIGMLERGLPGRDNGVAL